MTSFVVRIYNNGDSFHSLFDLPVLNPIPDWVHQFQVALTFARDYDANGTSTNGTFIPYWNRNIVTPAAINRLRERDPRIKVFVSIGGRDALYPFNITVDRPSWIAHAVESLTEIIQNYHLDGIDVYYEHITHDSGVHFVPAIGPLIVELRNGGAAKLASIAPSAPVNVDFYSPLYQHYGNFIDNVVYQSYNEPQPITTIQDFLTLYADLINAPNPYPSGKLLAGYSNYSPDWRTVSPPLYFIAFFFLLLGGKVNGPSIWTISDPFATFPPQWIIEIITLFLRLPEEQRNQLGLVFGANN